MEVIKQRKLIKSCIRGRKVPDEKVIFQDSAIGKIITRADAEENDIRAFIYDFSKGRKGDILLENIKLYEINHVIYNSILI